MTSVEEISGATAFPVRLVIFDICGVSLDDPNLRASISAVRRAFPRAELGILADRAGTELAVEALKLEIRGVFAKSQPIEAILAAIRIVLAGGFYCPRRGDCQDEIGSDFDTLPVDGEPPIAEDDVASAFTPREREVLDELKLGRSNKVIAGQLGLSENTVKMHIQRIMRKLQVQNRTEIVVRLAGLGQDVDIGPAARLHS